MRIISTVAAVIIAFGLQFTVGFSKDEGSSETLVSDPRPVDNVTASATDVDPVVTGVTVSSDHLAEWKRQSELYHACPECVANQPYPFPEE